jgi:hypothetical protein
MAPESAGSALALKVSDGARATNSHEAMAPRPRLAMVSRLKIAFCGTITARTMQQDKKPATQRSAFPERRGNDDSASA